MWSQSPNTKNSKYGTVVELSNSFAVSRCNWTKNKAHYLGHIVNKYVESSRTSVLTHTFLTENFPWIVGEFCLYEQIFPRRTNCVCVSLPRRQALDSTGKVECEIYLHVKSCNQNTWIKSSFMLVLAHMQVFCICIFLPVLPLLCRRFQWEAQEHLAVPFNSTPLIIFPLFLFFNLDYLDSSEEEDGDNQKVNIQSKQNCWVRQLRTSRAVIIP